MTRISIVACGAVALVLTGGCTSDGDSGSDTTDVPTTTAAAPRSTTQTLEADSRTDGRSLAQDGDADATVPETVPETTSGPEVLGPLGSTEVEITSDQGVVQIGVADLPDIVPDTFPVPDDLVVQLSSEIEEEAGFSGVTQLDFGELVTFYADELLAAGFAITDEQIVEDTVAVYTFEGSNGRGSVAISSAPGGGRSVLVTFGS